MTLSSFVIVVTALIYKEGKFLAVKRSDKEKIYPGKWTFPGGKVERGENVIQSIYREIEEEIGIKLQDKIAFLRSYTFGEKSDYPTVGVVFCVPYKSGKVRLGSDHSQHAWVTVEEFIRLDIIPGSETHIQNAELAVKHNLFIPRKLAQGVPNPE